MQKGPDKTKFAAYVTMSKLRIVTMVLVMTATGYFLAVGSLTPWPLFIFTLIGTGLSSAGAAALNNYIERDVDLLMHRTQMRPLPQKVLTPAEALTFGILLSLSGVGLLAWQVNLLTAFLSLLTVFLYVLVYTPLKRVTWLNTAIGAIPGALPPVGGWAAAVGHLDLGAWVLFAMLFIWQHPHFFAIAWMYREDYERGGFKMLPVVEPDGVSTFRQVIFFSLLLIPVSVLPAALGLAGIWYAVGVTALGLSMFIVSMNFTRTHTVADARMLLRASVIYLPLFFILIVADRLL